MEEDVRPVFNERLDFVLPMRPASEEVREVQAVSREVRAGSPARISYADAAPQEWKEGERVEVTRDLGVDPFRTGMGAAYPIPAGTRGNVRFDSLHSCPVLFDGFDEVQEVPTSWLRRI